MRREVQEIAEKVFFWFVRGGGWLGGRARNGVHEDLGIPGGACILGGAGAFQVEIQLQGFDRIVLPHLVAFKQRG